MYTEPNWGMDNIKRHKDCPFRTKLGNCDAIGGFCTSVNKTICEGIHKALNMSVETLKQKPKRGKWIDVSKSWSVKNACDQCGEIVFQPNYNYCPNCGAKMENNEE